MQTKREPPGGAEPFCANGRLPLFSARPSGRWVSRSYRAEPWLRRSDLLSDLLEQKRDASRSITSPRAAARDVDIRRSTDGDVMAARFVCPESFA